MDNVRPTLLPLFYSFGKQFACFLSGSSSSGNVNTSSPPKMKRNLLGKSPLTLASLSIATSLIYCGITSESSPPCSHYPGFKQAKMDLQGVQSQSYIHSSSAFHTISRFTTCKASHPPLSTSVLPFSSSVFSVMLATTWL